MTTIYDILKLPVELIGGGDVGRTVLQLRYDLIGRMLLTQQLIDDQRLTLNFLAEYQHIPIYYVIQFLENHNINLHVQNDLLPYIKYITSNVDVWRQSHHRLPTNLVLDIIKTSLVNMELTKVIIEYYRGDQDVTQQLRLIIDSKY